MVSGHGQRTVYRTPCNVDSLSVKVFQLLGMRCEDILLHIIL